MTPPRLVHAEPPEYPASRLPEHPTVVLQVVIDAEGRVVEATIEHTAGEEFDVAAVAAARRWRFEPAQRDGAPIPSRVRLAVHFDVPEFDLHQGGQRHGHVHMADDVRDPSAPEAAGPETPAGEREAAAPRGAGASEAARPEASESDSPDAEGEAEFRARGQVDVARLRTEDRGPSDFRIDRRVLEAAPHQEAADLLRTAPGVFIARPEGDAVAHRIMLRGFDAEHGQDLELTVDGLPINQPSHIHGQGYADLGFLIPEVIRSLRVTEGVYDPRQGDFAIAGTVDFELGVLDRGLRLQSTGGSFGTFRQLALWAPRGEQPDTFGAAVYRRTDGFGQNRAGASGSAIAQYGFGSGAWRFRVLGLFHAARADLAGVVRTDDVAAGRVGFYGAYDDATARAQSAATARAQLAFRGERRGEGGANDEIALYLLLQDLRLQANYTGYTERSIVNPMWVGRGDLIEQRNRDLAVGVRARHRTAEFQPFGWLAGHLELGLSARADVIRQSQALLQAPQNQTWDERVDASILGMDLGVYADVDLALGDYVRLRGGVRADVLYYDIDDRLGNRIPDFRRDDFIVGFRRSAFGVAAGPRATLEVRPAEALRLFAAYGEGYRSPQARTLADGEPAPFTKVRSADVGARLSVGPEGALVLTLSGFYTWLSDDVAFDPAEGRLERLAPTRRLGVTGYAVSQPFEWLTAALSVTYVQAVLLEAPPVTVENPNPVFEKGQALPFVPPWVVRLDLGGHRRLYRGERGELAGRLGTGFQYLGPRPLPFGQSAARVALLDVSGGLRFASGALGRTLDVGLAVYNLLDDRYAAAEYFFSSNWDPSSAPSRVPARHVAAGAPRTILLTAGVEL